MAPDVVNTERYLKDFPVQFVTPAVLAGELSTEERSFIMERLDGISDITDWQDLIIRTSMLFPDCGFESYLIQFDDNIKNSISSDERESWYRSVNSSVAISCIQRFSKIEGDFTNDSKNGLGRVSQNAFPRLGGVLYKHLKKMDINSSVIVSSIERNLHASYLAYLLINSKLRENKYIQDSDKLWDKWIPCSYNYNADITDEVDNIVAYGAYWGKLFNVLGLEKLERLLKATESELNKSIAGLSMVGVNLVLAERTNV